MDVLTLPEEGWALAYPSPHRDIAHLTHVDCGWLTPTPCEPTFLMCQRSLLMNGHRCAQVARRRRFWLLGRRA